MSSVIEFVAAVLLAVLAAVVALLALAGVTHLMRQRGGGLLVYVAVPILAVVAFGALTSGRDLGVPANELLWWPASSENPITRWLTRPATLFVLLAVAERILSYWLHPGVDGDPPRALIIAFACFWLTGEALPAAFGRFPAFSHEMFYGLAIGCGALLFGAREGAQAARVTHIALFAFMLVGAACLFIKPSLVLADNYTQGLIPGLDFRYAGLASGPNALGPLAVLALLLLGVYPWRRKIVNCAAAALGIFTLLLTQSKTSWLAMLFAAACLLVYRNGAAIAERFADDRRPAAAVLLIAPGGLLLLVAAGVLMVSDLVPRLVVFLDSPFGSDLLSLMGRDEIWNIALDEWRRNPIFGYGPLIWDDNYRFQIGVPAAFHAHNQLFETLARSGTVGAVGLLGYLAVLVVYAFRYARATSGLTLALLLLILVRALSEVPLMMMGYAPEQLPHFVLLMLLGAAARCESKQAALQSAPLPGHRLETR